MLGWGVASERNYRHYALGGVRGFVGRVRGFVGRVRGFMGEVRGRGSCFEGPFAFGFVWVSFGKVVLLI